jgi:3-phenylpropionate/cinnamic acid dioxygenase small subunit
MIDVNAAHSALARWWMNYDAGNFGLWPELLTEDVVFTCRSDSGEVEYEEFIRADLRGRESVLEWQTDHRRNSPYPLRHNATNVHILEVRGDEADFESYLFVTQILAGQVHSLSTAVVDGTVRMDNGIPRLAALHVVLDTRNSEVFASVATDAEAGNA